MLYGIPVEISEDEIYSGNYEKAINIGEITGVLILGTSLFDSNRDLYDAADEHSGEMEFVISALKQENGALADDYHDIFYIEDIQLTKKHNGMFRQIIKNLQNIVFNLYHVYPDVMCYYPAPLPYEESVDKKFKKEVATAVAGELIEASLKEEKDEEYRLTLDSEQLNYIMGRWNASDAYPESAKDVSLWKKYERVGFRESGNSRLLYKK